MKIVNCTAHPCTIGGVTYMPSGSPARVSVVSKKVREIDGIPVYREEIDHAFNVPAPEDDTVFIVSRLVCEAEWERDDLVFPTQLRRNNQGQVIGANAFGTCFDDDTDNDDPYYEEEQ